MENTPHPSEPTDARYQRRTSTARRLVGYSVIAWGLAGGTYLLIGAVIDGLARMVSPNPSGLDQAFWLRLVLLWAPIPLSLLWWWTRKTRSAMKTLIGSMIIALLGIALNMGVVLYIAMLLGG